MSTVTFLDYALEANAQGWYIYQLCQEDPNVCTEWNCCLRSLTGGPRRDISRGSGEDAISAICNALGAAPELEKETSYSTMPSPHPTVSIRHLFAKPREKMRRI